MGRFHCIADEDTVRGFRLAGIDGDVVISPEQAALALAKAANNPEVGIILLTLNVVADIREQIDKFRAERERPVLVEIPWPTDSRVQRKSLRECMQEAAGIQLDTEDSA